MSNSSNSPGGTGRIFPDATLPAIDGGAISLDTFRPRYDLVLVMLGTTGGVGDVALLLDTLAAGRKEVQGEDGKVLVIAAVDADHPAVEWRWPFRLLIDEGGRLHERVGAVDANGRPAPTLFVTDHYREIYGRMQPGDAEWPHTVDDVVQWLTFVNIQCPECNVPEWPVDDLTT